MVISGKAYAFPAIIFYYILEKNSTKSLLITSQKTLNINRLLLAGAGVHTETETSMKILQVLTLKCGHRVHSIKRHTNVAQRAVLNEDLGA